MSDTSKKTSQQNIDAYNRQFPYIEDLDWSNEQDLFLCSADFSITPDSKSDLLINTNNSSENSMYE